jgi:lipoate-protein ligase A
VVRVASTWRVEERVGNAASLHLGWPSVEADPTVRAVSLCAVTGPAVVLGSTQSDAEVDGDRASGRGIAVVRRRSGGGAVLVTPEDPVWIDVWLPTGDALWSDDVGRAFDWLGDTWVEALDRVGTPGLAAHRQGYQACTQWSATVCFGGVGSGEVVTRDGRKVVGLAQRRSRNGAWFHGACFIRWDPGPLVELLALPATEGARAVAGLQAAAVGLADLAGEAGRWAPGAVAVAGALIDALP